MSGRTVVPSHGAGPRDGTAAARGEAARWARFVVSRVAEAYGAPPVEIQLWDGTIAYRPDSPPVARVRIKDRSLVRSMLVDPELALGDGYADGSIEIDGDLVALLEAAFATSTRAPVWARAWTRLASWRPRRRAASAARENIHHHYDVGNEFFRLWLDDRLVYTCAYFESEEASLEQAQVAKLDHVCRKLDLRPGERVIEAGCGWGALALHMAQHYGVSVRAFNISRDQLRLARERASAAGLSERVEFIDDDWRAITGRCDAFVSVGMLEHVGRENYALLGDVIDRCLEPGGRGLVHSIGRAQPAPMDSWIERRIFPGSYIPSLGEMMDVFEPRRLAVLDVENLRRHYARTLEHWLERYEGSAREIAAMYDERFLRAWRLYLAASIASFRTGWCQLFQVVFSRAGSDALPWTREHLYRERPRAAEA